MSPIFVIFDCCVLLYLLTKLFMPDKSASVHDDKKSEAVVDGGVALVAPEKAVVQSEVSVYTLDDCDLMSEDNVEVQESAESKDAAKNRGDALMVSEGDVHELEETVSTKFEDYFKATEVDGRVMSDEAVKHSMVTIGVSLRPEDAVLEDDDAVNAKEHMDQGIHLNKAFVDTVNVVKESEDSVVAAVTPKNVAIETEETSSIEECEEDIKEDKKDDDKQQMRDGALNDAAMDWFSDEDDEGDNEHQWEWDWSDDSDSIVEVPITNQMQEPKDKDADQSIEDNCAANSVLQMAVLCKLIHDFIQADHFLVTEINDKNPDPKDSSPGVESKCPVEEVSKTCDPVVDLNTSVDGEHLGYDPCISNQTTCAGPSVYQQ